MHLYSRHIGDYAKDTRHLRMIEHGAYTLMLDWCYATERPLPLDEGELYRLCSAFDLAERRAVIRIRDEFFTQTPSGWSQKRVEKVIGDYSDKPTKAAYATFCREWKKLRINEPAPSFDQWKQDRDKHRLMIVRSSSDASPDHPTINHKPVTINQVVATITSNPPFPGLPDQPLSACEAPDFGEKKEGGGVWLDVGTMEARRAINAALGRKPHHALSGHEMSEIHTFATQHGGQISLDDLERLGRFLSAAPRYDTKDAAAWESVPKDSLLAKRKRWAGNVIADLANQMDYAEQWAAQGAKKERGAVSPQVPLGAPAHYAEAWQALYDGDPPPWGTLPAAEQAVIRDWKMKTKGDQA